MKKEKTECREVVVALLSQKYCDDKTVGEWVIYPKRVIRNTDGKCIGYAKFTLADLCERYPADEWMELVVRVVEMELLMNGENGNGNGWLRKICCNFEFIHQFEQYNKKCVEYYEKEIISYFLYSYNNLVEVKKYDYSDNYSLHRMSEGEFNIMWYLHLINSISFTKKVYELLIYIRQDYELILNGELDYFLGFSMSESEFIKFTNSRFVFNETIREV